jgi:hypothetical protein
MDSRSQWSSSPSLKEKCEKLKGHIYDCTVSNQANLNMKTKNEIADYAGQTWLQVQC